MADSAEKTVSKFAGEEFNSGNVRTVFAGASKDSIKRPDRIILLVGATESNKSNLIDCMCNYFYGAKFDGTHYKIADEIFDRSSTPMKSITKYIFNETTMPFRPVIIDTPEIAGDRETSTKEGATYSLHNFLTESQNIQFSALCFVLKFDEASIKKDEKIISETINSFPLHMLPITTILFSTNTEKASLSPAIKAILQNLSLTHNKYYFFNDFFLQSKGDEQDDEVAKEKVKLSWDLSMSELDRFCEQVKYLNPRQIVPDENAELSHDDMISYTPTSAQSSTTYVSHERIIPIKLVGRETTSRETPIHLRNWNRPETLVMKRYVHDPVTMTNIVTPMRRVYETMINDIPPENRPMMKRQLSPDDVRIKVSPPDHSTHHQRSAGPMPGVKTVINIESQQNAHSHYPKSAVQRQIARRTSSESEYSKGFGAIPQQQRWHSRQSVHLIQSHL